MKFLEKFSGIGRAGCLTEIPSVWRNVPVKTPMCLTYTCAGSVPHLTYDVLQHLTVSSMSLMLQPLPTIVDFRESVEKMGSGLGEFVGLPEYPFHISVQDPAVVTPSGFNVKKGCAVWTHGGKKLLSPKEFMEVQNAFCPFSYQALCDSDTPRDCSRKRLTKSVENTLNFLDQCLELHSNYPRLKDTSVFGTIQGGYDADLRIKSAKETAKRKVDGFVFDGFHLNGPQVRHIQFAKIKPILVDVISCLPPEKPRMMNGPLSPNAIIEAVKCGVDIFDTSYAYELTESGEALVLPFYACKDSDTEETPAKSLKHSIEVDLNEAVYADKYEPISQDCKCYTCRNFTCAYVHHLLVTSELLAKVLLMLHNMHQMSEFFTCIREAVASQSLEKLQKQLNAR